MKIKAACFLALFAITTCALASPADNAAINQCTQISVEYRENGNLPTSGDTEVLTDNLSVPEARTKAIAFVDTRKDVKVIKADDYCRVIINYTL